MHASRCLGSGQGGVRPNNAGATELAALQSDTTNQLSITACTDRRAATREWV